MSTDMAADPNDDLISQGITKIVSGVVDIYAALVRTTPARPTHAVPADMVSDGDSDDTLQAGKHRRNLARIKALHDAEDGWRGPVAALYGFLDADTWTWQRIAASRWTGIVQSVGMKSSASMSRWGYIATEGGQRRITDKGVQLLRTRGLDLPEWTQ